MCFSADVSLGTALALLPAGAYCLDAAWRKDRAYLPLAAVPVMFGVQQLCEGSVWAALDAGRPDLARAPSLAFLFFAFAVWPIGIPAAVAAVESGTRRRVCLAVTGIGAVVATACYLPIAAEGGRGLSPAVIGHSIRYDLSTVPAANWWVWMSLYLVTVCGPLLASRNEQLRPMGVAVAAAAAASYVLFEYAFASVWCLLAAVLSLYLAYVLYRIPGPPALGVGLR